ncbi:uncharacterized protein LOC135206778 [Macrobrachium nipponense]|uniref:uncharacterized protein LOC135206778 n=1 Tax=Macrobrachium nipponense TaxID=159736 RepID=UPI0030C812ED
MEIPADVVALRQEADRLRRQTRFLDGHVLRRLSELERKSGELMFRSIPRNRHLRLTKVGCTVDFHGLIRGECMQVLHSFLRDCVAQDVEEVVIITGKGLHSLRGEPVLKGVVEDYCRERCFRCTPDPWNEGRLTIRIKK